MNVVEIVRFNTRIFVKYIKSIYINLIDGKICLISIKCDKIVREFSRNFHVMKIIVDRCRSKYYDIELFIFYFDLMKHIPMIELDHLVSCTIEKISIFIMILIWNLYVFICN